MTATPSASPWQVRPMRIAAIEPELDGVVTYDLVDVDPPSITVPRATPGQFHMLYLPGIGEAAISLSGDCADSSRWRHTVRVAGRVTLTLAQLPIGAVIGVRGPFGCGWPVADWRGRDVILIAGGIGLAPMRPIMYAILRNRADFGRVTLIHGARTPAGLLYPAEYAAWEAAGITVLTTVDRAPADWTGHLGVVTQLLETLPLPQPEHAVVAACGPEVMMRYVALGAAKRGVPAEQVWVSLERNMQCAVGLCGHCQLGPEFVCKDGPVLRYDRVHHLLAVEAL